MEPAVDTFTYPIATIFDTDISSLVNEVSHHINIATLNCQMQKR